MRLPNRRHALIRLLFLIAFLVSPPGEVRAEKTREAPGEAAVEMKTTEVAIFKDGYALIKKTGRGTLNAAGELYIDEVPEAAVLGTFWATPAEGRLLAMTADRRLWLETAREEKICESTAEVVAANWGRECELTLSGEGGPETRLKGRIKELLLPELGAAPSSPVQFQPEDSSDLRRSAIPVNHPAEAGLNETRLGWLTGEAVRLPRPAFDFVLETDSGDLVLNTGQIKLLGGTGLKTSLTVESRTLKAGKRLTLRLDGTPGQQQEIVLLYFSPGLRWIPSYQVELPPDGRKAAAEIRLQGEILNELEDLADVKASLVVGVPHFRFRDTISPLSLEKRLRNALLEAAPQLMGGGSSRSGDMMSNAIMSQSRFVANRHVDEYEDFDSDATADIAPELSAGGSQDMFFYTVPSLTLRRQARAAVNLFSAAIDYKEIHTWNVHIRRAHQQSRGRDEESGGRPGLQLNEVWRTLEFHNTSGLPWTTGPAFFIQEGRPVAQEMLAYTPAGGKIRCPVTSAIDVRGRWSEREVGRELEALEWNDHTYSRIDMEAVFSIRNAKKTPVDIELLVKAGGEADTAVPAAELSHGDHQPDDWYGYWQAMSLNKQATALWRFSVPPGGEASASLKYHYFWSLLSG